MRHGIWGFVLIFAGLFAPWWLLLPLLLVFAATYKTQGQFDGKWDYWRLTG